MQWQDKIFQDQALQHVMPWIVFLLLRCMWNCLVMKNCIYIFGRTFLLMVALQNAWSVLEPSMFVLALARKHPWCFHSHSRPVLLTFTSAFMWPNPKANLKTHNMFINQFWSHMNKIWQNKDIPGDVLQFKSVAV